MKHSSVVQKVFVGLALSLAPVEAQRGYQLSGDEVVVDLAQHWRQWKIPAHLAHIDEAGSVRTRQLRTVYNVLEDRTLRRPITINTDDPRNWHDRQHYAVRCVWRADPQYAQRTGLRLLGAAGD